MKRNIEIIGNNYSAIKRYFISKMNLLFLLEANYSEGIFLSFKMVDYYQVNRPILAIGHQIQKCKVLSVNHNMVVVVFIFLIVKSKKYLIVKLYNKTEIKIVK